MLKKVFPVIGLIIFVLILLSIDLDKFIETIAGARLDYLFFALILGFIGIFIRALKWKTLIQTQGIKISSVKTFKYYLIGISAGLITPGRIGDLIKAFYIKEKINSLSKALSTVVVDRLIDIAILIIAGVLAVLIFGQFFNTVLVYYSSIVLLVIAFAMFLVIFLNKKIFKKLLKPLFYLFVSDKHKKLLKGGFDKFFESVEKMLQKKYFIVIATLFGIISWAISIIGAFFLAESINLNIPLYFMFLAIPIITLLDIVPISISGIGTRDVALIFLFSFIGLGIEYAVSFSFLYFLVFYIVTSLVGWGLFSTEKIDINKV